MENILNWLDLNNLANLNTTMHLQCESQSIIGNLDCTITAVQLGLLPLQTLKQRRQMLRTLLGISLLLIHVIHVAHTKPRLISIRPLKVVHQRPGKVTPDIHAIQRRRLRHGLDVAVVVLHSEVVLEELLERHVVLVLDAGAVLGDVHLGVVVALAEPDEEVAEAQGAGAEPFRLGFGADGVASLVAEADVDVAGEVIVTRGAVTVADVVGGVVVHAVKVIGTLDERCLFVRKGRQAIAELLAHGVWVFTKVNGIGEP